MSDDEDEHIYSPPHYIEGREIEPICVIEDWKLDHHLASAVKYISRAGRKASLRKDLKKAIWFLHRRINLEDEKDAGS
mgnify:CR=1 FL=1|tara:strand:- start:461 stop:694 length:234 start_codon:yes stop_codon:yes gene_type:complete